MGIEDIIYKELKNILTKPKKKEEIKKQAKSLIKKTLRRFIIDWEQFINSNPIKFYDETELFYARYRETLLNLFVELEDFIEDPIRTKLLQITDFLQKGQKTIPALGPLAYNERKRFGNLSVEIAKELIRELGDSNG